MKQVILSLSAVIILLLSGCYSTEVADSGDVNQDEIYQRYYVEYDAENNESFATAVFRFGGLKGTTLQLSDGSSISVNGEETRGEKEFLKGMVYRFENLSTKNTKYKFIFTNTDKKELKNSIELKPIKPISPEGKIKNLIESEITWEGVPVGSRESVQLTIKDSKGNSYSVGTDMKGAQSITISPDSLNVGIANLQLIRYSDKNLDEPTGAGGSMDGAYYSEVIPITISN